MSYDSWLQQPFQDQCDLEEQAQEAYDCEYEYIVSQIKEGKPFAYGTNRNTSADDCDLHDKVYDKQGEIMRLIATNNKDGLWAIMQDLFDKEIDSLVDLSIGVSKYD